MAEPRITAAMCAQTRGLAEPRLSPDGGTAAFVATTGGQPAIVTVPVAGGPERIVSADPTAARGGVFDWLPDGSGFVYAGRDGALWAISVDGGAPRRVAKHDEAATAPAVSPDGTRVAYVVGERDVAVVSLLPEAPWPVRLSRDNDFSMDPSWSADGQFVAWHEWSVPHMPWDESRWSIAPADGGGVVATMARDGVQMQQPRFAPVGSDLAYLCDADGWLNLWVFGPDRDNDGPLVCEPFEHGGPTWSGGNRSHAWSPDAGHIAFTRNEAGFGRLAVVRVADGEVGAVAKGVHTGLTWRGPTLLALRSGAVTPPELVAYDTSTWTRRVLVHGTVGGFTTALVEPEAVTWTADDGALLHGRLYRPREPMASPPPLLLWVHGGPTDQIAVEFRARFAYYLDRGWAILTPDHRGSTGHGRAYTQAMREGWGDLDIGDLDAAARAAAAQGWGDPGRLVAIGGSAGGFAVLHLLARAPERFAAGVALYPVTDLFELDERTHRYEKHYQQSLLGALPSAADRYRDRSPVRFADRITAPLLLLHGGADATVPVEQSKELEARLQRLGRDVELHVYEGEGHGWGRPATVIDEIQRTDDFLRRHVLRWRA